MFKIRTHAPGTAPATLELPVGHQAKEPVITLIEYDAHTFEERRIEDIAEVFGCRDNGKVSWINIDGLGDIEMLKKLGEHFQLHPLALEDTLNVGQRPKLEEYDDHFFIVLQMTFCEGEQFEFEQVSMFLKRNVLITIQEEERHDVFDSVRKRLRAGTGFARQRGHDYLAYALTDAVVDHFFPVLETMGDIIEDLEETMLDHPSKECVSKLHGLKRSLLRLRRAAWPQREVLSALNRDLTGMVEENTKPFLRDCYDHTIQIMDIIEGFRDLATGLMDLYLSSVGMRTNEIMRVLTVISAIFIPLTFLVGLYGMNFENMPELHTHYGYFVLLGVMAVLAIGMVIFVRRKRWL
jgi:magnesium transporter